MGDFDRMVLNQGYSYRHVVAGNAIGLSLVAYMAKHFSHSTVDEWQSRVNKGEVTIDDKRADGQERLRPGALVVWNRPGWHEESTPTSFDVLYCDDYFIAVNKPSGLPSQPGAGYYLNTLSSFVSSEFPGVRLVHRLGRATSGIVLFARSADSAARISRQWPDIRKRYRALASQVASRDFFDIRTPIGKVHHPRLGWVYAANESGKSAHSIAHAIRRREDSTLFGVELCTGRPHQIRIHLASIGHPLVGDPLYASGGMPLEDRPGLPGDSGYWLHAHRMQFEHPFHAKLIELEAPLPEILEY
jgi:23S rRNA pseudouridine1911/1915/1917 synthase